MKKIKLLLLLILLTLIVLVLFFAYSILTPISTEDKLVYFVIEPGQGFNQISNNLKAAGLVENQLIFETYVWLIDREDAFIAGEHQLNKKMTSRQLVRTLTSGSTVDSEIKIQKEEIKKYKWVKIGELKKYLVFPGYFERIQKVLKEFGILE